MHTLFVVERELTGTLIVHLHDSVTRSKTHHAHKTKSKYISNIVFLGKMGSTPEPHPWRGSMAQQVLQSLIVSGKIQCTTTNKAQMEEIWNVHCRPRQVFAGFQFAKFPARLRAMQKRHLAQRGHAEVEYAALLQHKQHFPTPSKNHQGEPQWHGSDAERLLKADVAAKLNETMAPRYLRLTRMEYQMFKLEVFRKHIHQEVRLQKLQLQYCKK
jgi:hypothetical protein